MASINAVADLKSLEELLMGKVSSLQIMKDVRGDWAGDTIDEFAALSKELQSIQREISSLRETIVQSKDDMKSALTLLSRMQQLSAVTLHMKDNLPSHLPRGLGSQPQSSGNAKVADKEKGEKGATNKSNPQEKEKGPPKGKSKNIPSIQYITMEEFDSVSKYIKGRLQYDQVNNAVDELNKAIESKYTLMNRPRAKLSEFDMKIVTACRQQENQETKGFYFVIDGDIKRWSMLRLDSAGRSMLTVLRTLKRLREIRGPGCLIRYAVL